MDINKKDKKILIILFSIIILGPFLLDLARRLIGYGRNIDFLIILIMGAVSILRNKTSL